MKEYYYLVTYCENHYPPDTLESVMVTLAQPIDNPDTYMRVVASLKESTGSKYLSVISINSLGSKDVEGPSSYLKLDYEVLAASDVCSILGARLADAQRSADTAEYIHNNYSSAGTYWEVCATIEKIADDLNMRDAVRFLASEVYNHNRAGSPGYILKGGQWVEPEEGIITQQ